jgi:beta-lactam-binding protein with PASTA domain
MPNNLVGMREDVAVQKLQELGVPKEHIIRTPQCRDDVPEADRNTFDQTPDGAVLSTEPRGNTPIDPAVVIVHLAVRETNNNCISRAIPTNVPATP